MKKDFDQEHFQNKLQELIKLNKVKHIDLAKHLGFSSKSVISNYISGEATPSVKTLTRIAYFFDINLDDLVGYARATLHEDDSQSCNIPVFDKVLASDTVIYRNDNYIGMLSSPVPVIADCDCYAVKIYDDSMKSFGFLQGSMVFFTPEGEFENGDIAAVLIKSKKQIFIRSVKLDKRKITLISDEKTEEFKITRNDCDAQILGKVVYAPFNLNKKCTD